MRNPSKKGAGQQLKHSVNLIHGFALRGKQIMNPIQVNVPHAHYARMLPTLLIAIMCIVTARSASAVLVPAGGTDAGIARIEHGVFGYAGASNPALFNGHFHPEFALGGNMFTPGFGFPVVGGGPVFEVDTGKQGLLPNVPIFLNTAPHGPSGFGGATSRLVGVGGGGRAGVAVTNYSLSDNNLNGSGLASTNTFAASVVYTNAGPAFNARFAHFLATSVNLAPGGLGMAGVKSIFEVGDYFPLTGVFNVDAFWEPAPILLAFDGLGIRADMVQGEFFNILPSGNSALFSAVSTTQPLFIGVNKSVRIRGAISLIADPASIDIIDLPLDMQAHLDGIDLGMGGSQNAEALVPEPSSIVMLGLGALTLGLGAVRRSRQRQ
jgi:hypothetical protein